MTFKNGTQGKETPQVRLLNKLKCNLFQKKNSFYEVLPYRLLYVSRAFFLVYLTPSSNKLLHLNFIVFIKIIENIIYIST